MIPDHMRAELEAYKRGEHPYEFGGFLTAVLAYDLIVPDYALYLSTEMPGRTGDATVDYWGSYKAVANRVAEQRAALAKAEGAS